MNETTQEKKKAGCLAEPLIQDARNCSAGVAAPCPSAGAHGPAPTLLTRTRAYLGYYPRDIAFAGTVAATLRSAGDVPSALAVEQLAREAQSGG